jgi:hypothetical protein
MVLGNIRPFPMIDMIFDAGDGGPDYLSGLDANVTYGGHSYLGAAGLIRIDPIEETADTAAGIRIGLMGMSANISLALGVKTQGRLLILRLALIDGSGTLQVDDNVWSGLMDAAVISDNLDNAIVTINAEHMLSIWDRPRPVRYTNAQQLKILAGDLGLQYVEEMAEANFVWPGKEFFK